MTRDEAQKIVNNQQAHHTGDVIDAICTLLATQEAPADEPMPCVCGCKVESIRDGEAWYVDCERCSCKTPKVKTREAAIRCWDALQREARR